MIVHGTLNLYIIINTDMQLGKYSFGVGDRFGQEGIAQLKALIKANKHGFDVTPVWNKSDREHKITGSQPAEVRTEADQAVQTLGWEGEYFVDADHINLSNVDRFIPYSDFFTIDVAGRIGVPADPARITAFKNSCKAFGSEIEVPGIALPIKITDELLDDMAAKYLAAMSEAGKIYRHIESVKGEGKFITEVSIDEVERPQTPVDMLFILKMIANEKIPVQTIAPKFTGRFNKGVDYVGDVNRFAKEFEEDVLVIDYAVKSFGLPENLKLSIHSGSDKFTIYPVMAHIIKKYDKGLHVKTAGTTWLEEVIGLAKASGDGLILAKTIYKTALKKMDELCAPYADVINIDKSKLPPVEEVNEWDSKKFVNTLQHIPGHPEYNSDVRQLIHVAYKVAAEPGNQYIFLLGKYRKVIGECVEDNIYNRHLRLLFDF